MTRRSTLTPLGTAFAALIALPVAMGCGSPGTKCVTGSTQECACPGGSKGVQACAADGTFGACNCASTNVAPSAPVVQMAPANPTDLQDIVCSIATPSSDANGDSVTYQFAWTKNGQPFAGASSGSNSSTVPASATSAADVFACAATANDGKALSTSSATASVTVMQSNRAPTAPTVAITPASPNDSQDIVCTITIAATDADNDSLTYQFAWTKNGQPFAGAVATGALASTVSAGATAAGDVLGCSATASDGKASGPAAATVSVTVAAATYPSCSAALTATPSAVDGLYDIDPDGLGPIAPAKLFCDMTNGGWTLVANIYDSTGDDAPNTTDYVVSGWQQTGNGTWANSATQVARNSSGTGSAAVSLAFVAALKASAGQQNLKMCFVRLDGSDSTCRSSADGSMTLVSYATGNSKLTIYSGNTLPYTFGRLAGLAGTVDGYNASLYQLAGYEIPVTNGSIREFGIGINNNTNLPSRLVDVPSSETYFGVWHGAGGGKAYRPWFADNRELSVEATAPDPQPAPSGFRLYVGP